jgi:hypothetical protein
MDEAKIRLSQAEIELIKNADLILTKNRILEKVREMLRQLVYPQQDILYDENEGLVPEEVVASSFKISRGENYLGLPWVVLDHPRYFSKEDVMALRTMCWWGRCFGVTLHLAGKYKLQYEKKILQRYEKLAAATEDPNGLPGKTFYICVNASQWEHHFDESNYRPVKELSRDEWHEIITGKSFIKLAKKIPLNAWEGRYKIIDVLSWHFYTLTDVLV